MSIATHLKSLQALEIAARTGSFTLAADVLGITPAAVGQRVKALEDYLGVPLLERGRAGIRPTPELRAALPHLHEGFAALEAASAALDLQRAQELHIAAVPDFADLWLKPRLPAFRAAHPNIRFCINGEGDAPLRLARVDCEILFAAPGEGSGQQDLLFHDFVVPLASPGICARAGRLDPAQGLEGFPLLHVDFHKDDPAGLSWPRWFAANGLDRTAPERGMRFRRIAGVLEAIRADAGIALGGIALIAGQIEAGEICLPFPPATGRPTANAFIARYRDAHTPNRMLDRFRTWLAGEASRTAAWVRSFVG